MEITDDKKIMDVQKEFNEKFPYLKIEFYKEHHEPGEGTKANAMVDTTETIGDVRTNHEEGDLSVDGHQKVSTFETRCYEKYGLNVQVFRKSGDVWLQTTSTDDWTLAEQNRKGEEMTKREEER